MKSVFISSTFKDMQAERDYLHEKLFPKLRKLLSKYGEDIQELDLRWGVDTYKMSEEESGTQVLRVCIDAIDRCKPYIIVLLGERYGWIPEAEIVESIQDERVLKQYEEDMSITNLEIKYGALSEKETLERCIFCFRNPNFIEKVPEGKREVFLAESEEHYQKLMLLKKKIREKENAKIIEYCVQWDDKQQFLVQFDELGESIYKFMEEHFRLELNGREARNPVQQYIIDAEYTKERYLSSYTSKLYEEKEGIEALNAMALNKVEQHHVEKYKKPAKEHCIHFLGEAGCGKSALMAYMEQQVKIAGAQSILYFSGNPGCQDIHTLKSVIIYKLEKILGIKHVVNVENQNAYLIKLDEQAKRIPIFCFVDALDQLFTGCQNIYLDILDLCPNLFIITSSIDDFLYEQSLMKARKIKVIRVQKLALREKMKLIQNTSAYRGKKIDEEVQKMICEKEGSKNPLFLSLLLQRMFAMRQEEFMQAETLAQGMDGLHLYMKQIIEEIPENITELASMLFIRVGEMFKSEFFKTVTYMIALSNTGLSEREVAEILEHQNIEFSQLKFQEILYYLYDVFTEKEDGKWVYSHRIFYEAMCKEMGDKYDKICQYLIQYSEYNPEFMEKEGYYHILINAHPLGKKVLENCRKWNSYRQVEELVYRLIREERVDAQYFQEMTDRENIEHLIDFWKDLDNYKRDEKVREIRCQIYKKYLADENISSEWKVKLHYEMLFYADGEEQEKHMQAARELLSVIQNPDERTLREAELDYSSSLIMFNKGMTEAGIEILKLAVEKTEKLMDSEVFREEALYHHILYRFMLNDSVERYQKRYLLEHIETILVLYDRYPEITKARRFQIKKIDILLNGVRQYRETGLKQYKSCAEEALLLAQKLTEEETEPKALDLLSRTLNYYGHNVDQENRYKYRYKALDACKRSYQLTRTNYWQQEMAMQAIFFAKDIWQRIQKKTIETKDGWIEKGEEAWKFAFECFDELSEKKYKYLDVKYFENNLLTYVEELRYKGEIQQAIIYVKKAYEIRKKKLDAGWKPEKLEDVYQCKEACRLFAELLEESLCMDEAAKYAKEQLYWTRKMYDAKYQFTETAELIMALSTVGRVFYENGQNEEALACAKEGEELLMILEKERTRIYPTVRFGFWYTILRVLLKEGKISEAGNYAEKLYRVNNEYLSEWEVGKKLLVYADWKAARGEYEAARRIFGMALSYWMEKEKEMKEEVFGLRNHRGFRIEKGQVKLNPKEKKWHIKAFIYCMYAIYRKAEVMEAGNLEDTKIDKSYIERIRKRVPRPYNALSEYKFAFSMSLEKLQEKSKEYYDEEYVKIAESYLVKSIHKILKLTNADPDADVEYYVSLFEYAAYCKGREIDPSEQFKLFADALRERNLSTFSISLAMLKGNECYWLDIYSYIKEYAEKGLEINVENKRMIAWVWLKFGCYKEAVKWLAQVKSHHADQTKWVCQAMCASFEGNMEKALELARRADESFNQDSSYCRGTLIEDLCNELLGNVEKVINHSDLEITRQEQAQRYINVLKIAVESGKYFSFSDPIKEKFWDMAETASFYYHQYNKSLNHLRKVNDTWEEQADVMRKLTDGGMTWEIEYKDVERIIFTLFEKLYDSCPSEEMRKEVSKQICIYWRKHPWNVDLYKVSLENLLFIRKIEKICGYTPLPPVMEALSVRMEDEKIFHDFFGKTQEYLEFKEWKNGLNMRQHEILRIFENLLEKDQKKWEKDFKMWITSEENLWIAEKMNFFKEPEEIGNDPEKIVFYDVYRKYMLKFKEKYREELKENVGLCEL